MLKECSKCKKIKRFWEFVKDKRNKIGLGSWCKECNSKKNSEYFILNKDKFYKRARKYYENNKDKFKEKSRKYHEDNKEERNRKRRKRYLDNREYELKLTEIRNLKNNYGITLEERDNLIKVQDYKCKICNKEFNNNINNDRACVDHDHKTGEIRGILCSQCNLIIGHANDNVNILYNTIKYLIGE